MKKRIAYPLAALFTAAFTTVGALAAPLSFSDVPEDAAYAPAVTWAVSAGITSGTGDTTFSPELTCSTAQVLTLLWRANGAPEPASASPFSDVPSDAYYEKAAAWAYEQGLVSGSALDGDLPCTLSQALTYLWKLAGSPAVSTEGVNVEQPWNLTLVNPWNQLPQDFSVQLKTVSGHYSVDQRCWQALKDMLVDCRRSGASPLICSAYRTQQKQESLYAKEVARQRSLGLSPEDAPQAAARVVALPGTSEHQLGLAVDLVDKYNQRLEKSQESTRSQQWLMAHSWEYGFILRYPNDKSDITGIIYEPWHYRYVGKEIAREMYRQGLCLEEYLAQQEQVTAWALLQGLIDAPSVEGSCTRQQLVSLLYQTQH